MTLYIDLIKCNGCMNCVDVCPVNALSVKNNKCELIKKDKCSDCGICVFACPKSALSII